MYNEYAPKPPKKKKHRLRKFICWSAVILVVVFVAGFFLSDIEVNRSGNDDLMGELFDEGETWAIYWYLCGSDLESKFGFASTDLKELCSVTLPNNVQVIIETGGSKEWEDSRVDEDNLCRWLYSGSELTLLEQLPSGNMSNGETLSDFLFFCRENYPADHQAAVLWDHGGGSVGGVICDENYGMKAMGLLELREAFVQACEPSEKNPPLEIIGFDACLMSTIEAANMFKDIAHYMVASEDTEPGCGWNYTGFLQALAEQPRLNGAMLGKTICDAYAEGCKAKSVAGEITLSCIDLSRAQPLLAAWHNVGVEALAAACENPRFFSAYGRSAEAAEKYGPNERDRGYTGMVDMGSLVRRAAEVLPETAQSIEEALSGCVVYRVNGPYRMENTGLACYYPLDLKEDSLASYIDISASEAHSYLYEYLVYGKLSLEGAEYAAEMEFINIPGLQTPEAPKVPEYQQNSLPETPGIADLDLEDHPVALDEDNNATLTLGRDIADLLTGIYFELAYVDEEEDLILLLGRDNDLYADWENGVFTDNFWGEWGSIDGNLVYMELVFEGDDYDLYSVPILLNGEECSLRVCYVYEEEAFEILGAYRGLDDNGMAGKELIHLQPGDKITTLHYVMSLSDSSEDILQTEIDTFTVTEETSFHYEDLGDGQFVFLFEMVDARNSSAYSEAVTFTVEDGEIFVETD